MTEKEIVQALRCCTDHSCSAKCPAYQAGLDCREEMHKAVLNLVENLTAENASLREHNRWIPVTEKTPEYDMPQLVLNADGDALIANYAYGEWFDTWGQDVEVTHWMPLPEGPEEGDKHGTTD